MATRRTHTKSRHGCTNCKRRKVKCDEAFPCCFHCKRHNIPCSLGAVAGPEAEAKRRSIYNIAFAPITASASPTPHDASTQGGSSAAAAAAAFGQDAAVSSSASSPVPDFLQMPSLMHSTRVGNLPVNDPWSRDAELMHHYCTVTADTMALRDDVRHVWKVVVPREGYDCRFVMHGILSMAATHKALLVPSRSHLYVGVAAYHQVLGSEGFRAIMADVSGENWRPVFCFTSLMVMFYMSLPVRTEGRRLETPILSMLDMFSAHKGIRATVAPYLVRLTNSEFTPLVLRVWEAEETGEKSALPSLEHSALPPNTYDAIRQLRGFLDAQPAHPTKKHYIDAAVTLETVATLIARRGVHAEPGAVMYWPYVVDDALCRDMRALRPHALLLLAYYMGLLVTFEASSWLMRGWAKPVVRDIERQLAGMPEMGVWLEWPREQVAMGSD